jgi:hypothetical protein
LRKLALIILFFLPLCVFSQQEKVLNYQEIDMKPFHFGYTLGLNTMDFGIYPSEVAVANDTFPEINRLSPGVDIGIVTNFRLTEYLDFRFLPGISLGQRNLLFYESNDTSWNPHSEMKLGSTFINLPFSMRYEAQRVYNYRPYLIGGVNFRWDMARNKDFNADEGIFVKLQPFDIYFEGGFGVDFYLPYFKLSIELKYSVGTINVLSPDAHDRYPGYANSIDKLKSRMFSLSFHFE